MCARSGNCGMCPPNQARGLDQTLLESEREAVLVACHSGNKHRMQMIVKGIYLPGDLCKFE